MKNNPCVKCKVRSLGCVGRCSEKIAADYRAEMRRNSGMTSKDFIYPEVNFKNENFQERI